MKEILHYVCFVTIAIWGAAIELMRQVVEDDKQLSLAQVALVLSTSSFVGLMIAFLSVTMSAHWAITGVCCGIGGTMSNTVIRMLQRALRIKLKNLLGLNKK